jgi:hypothetical protein
VHAVDAARIAFAVAVVVAAASLATAAIGRGRRAVLLWLAAAFAVAGVAAWVAFALGPDADLGVAAAGLLVTAAAEIAALKLRGEVARSRRLDEQLEQAEARVASVIAREAEDRAAELERTLARARAESVSLLAEQERRVAEERRRTADEREHAAADALTHALATVQAQVERRLQEWRDDLDRAQRAIGEELKRLGQRQRQLISEAETRIAADAERLEAESVQQREGVVRLRDDLARVTQETVAAGSQELETFAADRRRALHELNDRIRRRERTLADQIEREETEAMRRIQAGFADVERRQVEQLERIVSRTTSSYAEAAAQQFADAIRAARDNAATRLSRELDRAVESFAREAESALAERLAHVGDAGAQRIERRLSQVTEGLERQRAEAIMAFESRLTAAEHELRRRLDTLAADGEAERAVLEARLHELARRIDEAIART